MPKTILEASRASEWWEFKFAPIFCFVYATALISDIPLVSLPSFLLLLLISLIPGAVYVSVINDLTDIEVDRRAGKKNRIDGKPRALVYLVISICIAIGIMIGAILDRISLLMYLGAWVSYSLYSIPPIRLKRRGVLGVLADALGANVFPILFAIAFFAYWFGREIDCVWLTTVGFWSLCWGIRGIVWHQLKDLVNDQKSLVQTFVQKYGVSSAENILRFGVFPIEVLLFGAVLVQIGSVLPFVFLFLYLFMEYLRYIFWETDIIVVSAKNPLSRILMEDYYSLFFSISLLVTGAINYSASLLIIPFHFIIFPGKLLSLTKEISKLYEIAYSRIKHVLYNLINRSG